MFRVMSHRPGVENELLWMGSSPKEGVKRYNAAVRKARNAPHTIIELEGPAPAKLRDRTPGTTTWLILRRFNSLAPVGSRFRHSKHHGDLAPQPITRPARRPGLVDVVVVDQHGTIVDVLKKDLPYSAAVELIRAKARLS
jgi:hypothetical protein